MDTLECEDANAAMPMFCLAAFVYMSRWMAPSESSDPHMLQHLTGAGCHPTMDRYSDKSLSYSEMSVPCMRLPLRDIDA